MAGTQPTETPHRAETTSASFVPKASTWAVWSLFALGLVVLGNEIAGGYEPAVPDLFVVDGLTAVMWVVVTFFSGIVHSYSRRYMAGDRHLDGFYARVFGFTLVVMVLTAADHVALFAAAWLGMGLLMASLIGHVREWKQARAAASLARRYFLASSGLLAGGLLLLAWTTGRTSLSGILEATATVPQWVAALAIGGIVLAAIIQSALFPFQNWLLSSMTAPTPASALMHAGFVNAGGILLTRFAPLLTETAVAMSAIVLIGATSALLGQAMLLVGTNVKRELGASTMAQMGFMTLQCGLGFFAAAIAHLILHGFYKAYLFLSSGAAVEQTVPGHNGRRPPAVPSIAVGLLTALGGGALFAVLTGKGMALNSGLLLVLVVVLTTLHATRDILRRSTLPQWLRLVGTPAVVLAAIGTYAVVFNAISAVMKDVPMTTAPTELTVVHVAVGALFVGAYAASALEWHRQSKRLYVALLNLAQPDPATVLTNKEDYDDA
ncbi:proton-conducting transporter transmembrane domain-containing protein [Natronomonas sp.]|uniref:proton-conducting transporter transmembrane domain-containing protein n=1 Tax=Natronomonas sp. TaxID=2184060 RepID=UPI002FC3AC3E